MRLSSVVSVPADLAWVVEKAIREALVTVEMMKQEPAGSFARDWKAGDGQVTVCLLWPAKDETLSVDTQIRRSA